jgi:hypothetical protein
LSVAGSSIELVIGKLVINEDNLGKNCCGIREVNLLEGMRKILQEF